METLGLIAGNGNFPFLILEAARAKGLRVVVVALKEETDPEINDRAAADPEGVRVYWISLGELSRLIQILQHEGVTEAVMAGQVRHRQIFSSIRPDWRLAKLLLNLRSRNTDMLLGAVAGVLADEGIALLSSTRFLEPMLAPEGVLTRRAPDTEEQRDMAYGGRVARGLAAFDLGQTVVVAAGACVAVEAMEGTDATIERAGDLLRVFGDDAGTLSRRLTVVKVAKPQQDLRFDVPVVGEPTILAMASAGASCLCVEAGRTLLFDREGMVRAADAAGIAVFGMAAPSPGKP